MRVTFETWRIINGKPVPCFLIMDHPSFRDFEGVAGVEYLERIGLPIPPYPTFNWWFADRCDRRTRNDAMLTEVCDAKRF